MAIATVTGRRNAGSGYTTPATHITAFSTAPSGSTPGTEVTGGSYARKAVTWSAPVTSGSTEVYTGTTTTPFDIPASQTVAGLGLYTALTVGTYLDGSSVTSQPFSSAGTYNPTITYTQS